MQTEPPSRESCGIEDLVEDPLKKALQDLQISPGSNAGSSVYVSEVPEKAEWEESLKAEPVQVVERGAFNLEEQDERAWSETSSPAVAHERSIAGCADCDRYCLCNRTFEFDSFRDNGSNSINSCKPVEKQQRRTAAQGLNQQSRGEQC